MRSGLLFFVGLSIDAVILIITVSNLLMMNTAIKALPDPQGTVADDFSTIGQLIVWLIPILLISLIVAAFLLRSTGKLLLANILLWIPALPMAGGILLWGGLAILFVIFGASH